MIDTADLRAALNGVGEEGCKRPKRKACSAPLEYHYELRRKTDSIGVRLWRSVPPGVRGDWRLAVHHTVGGKTTRIATFQAAQAATAIRLAHAWISKQEAQPC